jgi:hypothetical protein
MACVAVREFDQCLHVAVRRRDKLVSRNARLFVLLSVDERRSGRTGSVTAACFAVVYPDECEHERPSGWSERSGKEEGVNKHKVRFEVGGGQENIHVGAILRLVFIRLTRRISAVATLMPRRDRRGRRGHRSTRRGLRFFHGHTELAYSTLETLFPSVVLGKNSAVTLSRHTLTTREKRVRRSTRRDSQLI